MMNKIEKYSDKDWEEIASLLSGESASSTENLSEFREEDHLNTEKNWDEMGKSGKNKNIDVDKAWRKIYSRIEENEAGSKTKTEASRFTMRTFMQIAAGLVIVAGLGAAVLYLVNTNAFSSGTVVATTAYERNMQVSLPDGSTVFLNRNSELSYFKNPGKSSRNVTLRGEAFFDIKHDPSKPFIINGGKASIKVLGTSFSVLTNNTYNAVEVFVKTGSVMLFNNSDNRNLILEPGYIGTMDKETSGKMVNEDPNYLSWNTDLLFYEGKKLSVVFSDLKKVFDIDVVADNPAILDELITTTFEKEPQDTIIRIICSTFNLSYRKEGTVYHLSKR
jgi:transmembrane sensor